jgi:hypothetical protein
MMRFSRSRYVEGLRRSFRWKIEEGKAGWVYFWLHPTNTYADGVLVLNRYSPNGF